MDFNQREFCGNEHTQSPTFCWAACCSGEGNLQVEEAPLEEPQQIPKEEEASEGAQPTLLSSPPMLAR